MKKIYLILLILVGMHLFMLSKITFFPNSELFVYPYLTNQGLVPYKDIWDQHTPGLLFFPINFDNLGMNTPTDALRWHLSVITINHLLIYVLARKFFKSEKTAIFTNALYVIFQPLYEGYIQWLDVFLPIFILSALYFYYEFLEKEKIRDLLISGIIVGLGLVFKQVLLPFGAVLGLLLLLRRNIREIVVFGIAVTAPVIGMFWYLYSIGALESFWYWAVTYNLTVFAKSGTKAIPSISHFIRFIAIYGLAVFYFVINLKDKKMLILGSSFIASLATVAARFDFVHLQASLPLALIIIAFGLLNQKNFIRNMGIGYVLILFSIFWSSLFYWKHAGKGVLFFDDNVYKTAGLIRNLTYPGDEIFLFGSETHLYQMTDTIPAGREFVFQFPWFLEVVENELVENLVESEPNVVVRNRTVTMQGNKIIDYATELDNYINNNYEVFDKIGENEVMVRKN